MTDGKALQLADRFDAGYFDAIVGKTLIDCFLTRTGATLFPNARINMVNPQDMCSRIFL